MSASQTGRWGASIRRWDSRAEVAEPSHPSGRRGPGGDRLRAVAESEAVGSGSAAMNAAACSRRVLVVGVGMPCPGGSGSERSIADTAGSGAGCLWVDALGVEQSAKISYAGFPSEVVPAEHQILRAGQQARTRRSDN